MEGTRWIVRHGSPVRGFRYLDATGQPVRDRRVLARIAALRIPPAWREVHIAASPRAVVQAWGIDARGRKQYRYHERAVEAREARKYHRLRQLGHDLPRLRAALRRDLARPTLDRDRVAALVVALLGKGFFRIGSERYLRENGTFGLVTLKTRHVAVAGEVLTFTYRGKGGKWQRRVIIDRRLARHVSRLQRVGGARLFRYCDEAGAWHDLTAREVNAYLQRVMGARYTAKDFRTWGGTLRVATVLADLGSPSGSREAQGNVALAIRLVAAELGNTPPICRGSYVHPIVLGRYLEAGETIALDGRRVGARSGRRRAPEERALVRFLDRHAPERRRRPRAEPRVARERSAALRFPRAPRSRRSLVARG